MDAPQDFTVRDLSRVDDAPDAGILSRTLHAGEHARAILFSFASGEELSEHTSSRPAMIHVLSGELELTLAGTEVPGPPGTWVYMAPGLPHAVRARVPSAMLLTLVEASAGTRDA